MIVETEPVSCSTIVPLEWWTGLASAKLLDCRHSYSGPQPAYVKILLGWPGSAPPCSQRGCVAGLDPGTNKSGRIRLSCRTWGRIYLQIPEQVMVSASLTLRPCLPEPNPQSSGVLGGSLPNPHWRNCVNLDQLQALNRSIFRRLFFFGNGANQSIAFVNWTWLPFKIPWNLPFSPLLVEYFLFSHFLLTLCLFAHSSLTYLNNLHSCEIHFHFHKGVTLIRPSLQQRMWLFSIPSSSGRLVHTHH